MNKSPEADVLCWWCRKFFSVWNYYPLILQIHMWRYTFCIITKGLPKRKHTWKSEHLTRCSTNRFYLTCRTMRGSLTSVWSSSCWTGTVWLRTRSLAAWTSALGRPDRSSTTGTKSWTVPGNRLPSGINLENDLVTDTNWVW